MKKKRFLIIYIAVVVLLSAALTAWRCAGLFVQLDSDPSFVSVSDAYYEASGNLFYFLFGILLLCILLCIPLRSFSLAVNEQAEEQSCKGIKSACAICYMTGGLILCIWSFVETMRDIGSSLFADFVLFDSIFMFLAGLYFLISLLKKDSRQAKILSFFPTLYVLTFLLVSYFCSDYSMNNPIRKLSNLAFTFLMLCFLTETKRAVGYPMGRFYPAFLLTSVCAVSVYLIPNLITAYAWITKASLFFFTSELLSLSALLLMVGRLIFCLKSLREEPADAKQDTAFRQP